MQPIRMVDLFGQYKTIKSEVDTAIEEVISSSVFIKGGKVNDFEKCFSEYLKTNVVTCGNGTDALELIFRALGLKPGDEVITTPFTFVSSVEVLALLKLKPVFVDALPGTFNLDHTKIEEAISRKTKAILPVHLFGQSCHMEKIMEVASRFNLPVIEDAAQSIGTDYFLTNGETQKSGTLGLASATSFFPSKTLGAFGDGGAILCQDKGFADKIRSLANHGRKATYEYSRIGMNSRLDSIQAAILEVKLRHLDKFIKARQKAAEFYDEKLKAVSGITIPERVSYSSHSYHQYTIRCKYRDQLKEFLANREIPSMVYYPTPLHLQEAYKFLGYTKGNFPVSENLADTVLSLPMHTELDKEQLNYISKSIIDFFEKYPNKFEIER